MSPALPSTLKDASTGAQDKSNPQLREHLHQILIWTGIFWYEIDMATEIRVAGAKPWGSNANLLTAVPRLTAGILQGVGHLPAAGLREVWEQQ